MQHSINAAIGALIAECPMHDDAAIEDALAEAATAQAAWRRVGIF